AQPPAGRAGGTPFPPLRLLLWTEKGGPARLAAHREAPPPAPPLALCSHESVSHRLVSGRPSQFDRRPSLRREERRHRLCCYRGYDRLCPRLWAKARTSAALLLQQLPSSRLRPERTARRSPACTLRHA